MAEVREGTASVADPDVRVQRITGLVQHLLLDIARAGHGEVPDLECLAPTCAAAVRQALAAVGGDDARIEADFGETVDGTALLPEVGGPVCVELLVDDRSLWREPGGRRSPLPPARWLLELRLDERCTRITNLRVAAT